MSIDWNHIYHLAHIYGFGVICGIGIAGIIVAFGDIVAFLRDPWPASAERRDRDGDQDRLHGHRPR